nr:HEAT repeat domain-containing protein [Herpetosiphonaceae bacterium]
YLTIENRGWIERELRPLMGNWIMGCDICQAVCPWQRFAIQTQETGFYPSDLDRAAPALLDLLALTDESFAARYAATPLSRIKRERLVRNACIASGNWGDPSASLPLGNLLGDDSPLVRGHAAWALGRIGGLAARAALAARLPPEPDPLVREEIEWALVAIGPL